MQITGLAPAFVAFIASATALAINPASMDHELATRAATNAEKMYKLMARNGVPGDFAARKVADELAKRQNSCMTASDGHTVCMSCFVAGFEVCCTSEDETTKTILWEDCNGEK